MTRKMIGKIVFKNSLCSLWFIVSVVTRLLGHKEHKGDTKCTKLQLYFHSFGFAGLIGLSKEFTPRVFNFRRNTLSPADTYNTLKSVPPKQTFEACPFDGGIGRIASTRPN